MRVRTTWNPELVKQAAMNRQADPYTMNQTRTNPPSSKYETGSPSSWAEDPTPSAGTWEAEYSNGQVKREEIGLPEFRKDTFNHPDKTASEQQQDAEELTKKAMLAEKVARRMLPKTASDALVEDQAFAMMQLPNEDLVSTYARLAAQDEQQDSGKPWEDKKAQEQQAEEQQKQAQQQEQQDKQAQQQEQDKQAGQMPPQFKENAEKKKEEAEGKKDDGQKEASFTLSAKDLSAAIAEGVRLALAAQQGQEQQDKQAQQQQEQDKQACGQPMAAPVMSEDGMLDQMLADQSPMMEGDILLDAPEMGVGDISGLGPDDDVLMSLFATDEQQGQEQQKQAQEQAQEQSQQKQASRAMGTRPTGGVPRVGGGTNRVASTADVNANLERLWTSAPDVSAAFGMSRLPTTPAPASPPGPHPTRDA